MALGNLLKSLTHHQRSSWFVTGELGVPKDVSRTIWKVHYVTFASLFTLLLLFILTSVLTLVQDSLTKKFMRRNHFLWVNVALLYFCLMTVLPFYIDPYENRRHMRPRSVRQAVHLVIRLRLPCLSLAFLLVHISLLNITKLRLYATRCSNVILIYVLSIIHFTLILISTVSTMFQGSYAIVWLLCDMYTCALFLLFATVSTYTGGRILLDYHRDMNVFRKVISSTTSSHGQTNSGFVYDEIAEVVDSNENDNKVGKDITGNKIEVSDLEKTPPSFDNGSDYKMDTNGSKSGIGRDKNDATGCGTEEDLFHDNPYDNVFTDFPKRGSQFPIYRDERKSKKRKELGMNQQKVIIESRSIGSMPYQTHSSKFADKSIVKVVVLTVVVSSCQLLLSIGMVVALLSAYWFDGHNLQGWKWYMLRTCLRGFELGAVGTMAYLVRRSCCF